MSLDDILKDVGEVYSRLFDHRPFLSGEIKFFLREYEEKRGDREVEKLFQILEQVTEMRETSIDKAVMYGDKQLPNLSANFEVAVGMCNRILEDEDRLNVDYLDKQRKRREKQQLKFVKDSDDTKNRVDATFEQKENELKSYYLELEQKLRIGT